MKIKIVVKPPNSDLDLKCFEILLEANRKLQINQETIQTFLPVWLLRCQG